jgi:hypothetical protein
MEIEYDPAKSAKNAKERGLPFDLGEREAVIFQAPARRSCDVLDFLAVPLGGEAKRGFLSNPMFSRFFAGIFLLKPTGRAPAAATGKCDVPVPLIYAGYI